jgi:hypothetical protein
MGQRRIGRHYGKEGNQSYGHTQLKEAFVRSVRTKARVHMALRYSPKEDGYILADNILLPTSVSIFIIAALMAGERELTDLGIVTDKFSDGVVNICGCCRQFIIEFSKKFNWHLAIRCFSQRTKESAQYRIEELLPHSWSSNKW